MENSMEKVLQKFRELHHLFQEDERLINMTQQYLHHELPFQNSAKILSDVTESNIYILNEEGILVGMHEIQGMDNERFSSYLNTRQFPRFYLTYLSRITETKANLTAEQESTIFPVENKEFHDGVTTIVPIFVSGQRLGNLILGRLGRQFDVGDLLLAEYCATVIGIELLHFTNVKKQEEKSIREQVDLAISSLSYSEKKAVKCIFQDIHSLETRITASKVASQYNITRSVIVNALRKLESAGLLESQSLGMKGTFIKVKSQAILDRLLGGL